MDTPQHDAPDHDPEYSASGDEFLPDGDAEDWDDDDDDDDDGGGKA